MIRALSPAFELECATSEVQLRLLRADSVLIMNDRPHEITEASVPNGSSGMPVAAETTLSRSKRSIAAWPFCTAVVLLAALFLTINWQIAIGHRVQRWDACLFYTPAF